MRAQGSEKLKEERQVECARERLVLAALSRPRERLMPARVHLTCAARTYTRAARRRNVDDSPGAFRSPGRYTAAAEGSRYAGPSAHGALVSTIRRYGIVCQFNSRRKQISDRYASCFYSSKRTGILDCGATNCLIVLYHVKDRQSSLRPTSIDKRVVVHAV